jgi:hypothetical protein
MHKAFMQSKNQRYQRNQPNQRSGLLPANALLARLTAVFSLRLAYLALKVNFSKLSKPPFTAKLYKLAALRPAEESQARRLKENEPSKYFIQCQ